MQIKNQQASLTVSAARTLEWMVKFLVVVTPLAYLAGRNFFQGYLSAFGVDGDLIQIPMDEALIYAPWALFLALMPLWELLGLILDSISIFGVWIGLAGLMLVIIVTLRYPISFFRRTRKAKPRWLRKLRVFILRTAEPKRSPTARSVEISFKAVGFVLNAIWVLLLLLMLGPKIATESGQVGAEWAVKERKQFDLQGCLLGGGYEKNWSRCVELMGSDGRVKLKGLLLHQTPLGLAIYDGQYTRVLSLQTGQELRFSLLDKEAK